MTKIFTTIIPVLIWLLVAPTLAYSEEIPSWIDDCETCEIMAATMADTNCQFRFDEVIDISQTNMSRDTKIDVISKLFNEFFDCALPEQEEEIRKELIPTMLLELTELAENNTKLGEKIENQNTRILQLEEQSTSLSIGFFVGGLVGGDPVRRVPELAEDLG